MMVQNETHFPNLHWSTSISGLLAPDFALSKEYESSRTTPEDALSHRSGLPRHDFAYGWGNATVLKNVRRMRYLPMTAEPRPRWQYCNLMYGAIGALIEKHTCSALEDVLRTWTWESLRMRSTAFAARSDEARKNLARGYHWHKEDYYIPEKYYDLTSVAGAGAIISSVNDYALWLKALLNAAGPSFIKKTNPISTKLFADVTAPRVVLPNEYRSSGAPLTYALGWILARGGPYNVITHAGGVPVFLTDVFLVPELRLGFVSVANSWSEDAAPVGTKLFVEGLKGLVKMDVESLNVDGLVELKKDMMLLPHLERDVAQIQNVDPRPEAAKPESRPLPGDIHDYIGLYSHPAYGVLNISVLLDNQMTKSSFTMQQTPLVAPKPSSILILLGEPTPRLSSTAFAFWHKIVTTYDAQALILHGDDNDVEGCERSMHGANPSKGRTVECRNEAVIAVAFVSKAMFEFSLKFGVERLGVEIEPEMMRVAKECPNREGWKKGMMWFEKIGQS